MSEVKSPYVNELNGRKIVFIKRDDSVIGDPDQCKHCVMHYEDECSKLVDDNRVLMCERDRESVWQYAPEVSEEPSAKPPKPAAGRKFDSGKPRYSLIPPNALEEVARVLTYGSQKYEDHNWLRVDNANDRFFSAANRHMWAWKKGEKIDDENQCSHLAAAIASLMFILELEFIDGKNKTAT